MSQDKVTNSGKGKTRKNLKDHVVQPALILLIYNMRSCELPRKKLLFNLVSHSLNQYTPHHFRKTHCCMQKSRLTKKDKWVMIYLQIIQNVVNRRSPNAGKHSAKLDLFTTCQDKLIRWVLEHSCWAWVLYFRLCTWILFNPSKPREPGRALTPLLLLRKTPRGNEAI